jgi:hypothetical protein
MSSGIHVTSRTEAVICREVVKLHGEFYEYGCNYSGPVDVGYDYETGETWWRCPSCAFDHHGLIP